MALLDNAVAMMVFIGWVLLISTLKWVQFFFGPPGRWLAANGQIAPIAGEQ
jgi:hypothetical protein